MHTFLLFISKKVIDENIKQTTTQVVEETCQADSNKLTPVDNDNLLYL